MSGSTERIIHIEVAKAYEQRMGSWSKLLSPLFIEFVRVQGEVLDVGCGIGSLTFTVAKTRTSLGLSASTPPPDLSSTRGHLI
jgi:2-polyprenyl-3-methyl-5-hydroxy-6-metoxy-1,4-benzoquinol methylase